MLYALEMMEAVEGEFCLLEVVSPKPDCKHTGYESVASSDCYSPA